MTYEENRQRIKNEALNSIAKLYHPLYKSNYTYYPGEGSFTEQRDGEVKELIENMNMQLERIKKEYQTENQKEQ
jgi:hypothetical protein